MRHHAALLACCLASLPGCDRPSPPATPPAAPISESSTSKTPAQTAMPVEILHVELGNALAADQRVLMPRINFAPADTIYASVILAGRDATPHHIEATWSHLDSRQTVYAEPRTLALSGEVTTVFHIRKPDGWPGGQYQLQLAVDGHIVQTRLFDVIAPPPVVPQPAPAPPAPAPAPAPTPSP